MENKIENKILVDFIMFKRGKSFMPIKLEPLYWKIILNYIMTILETFTLIAIKTNNISINMEPFFWIAITRKNT